MDILSTGQKIKRARIYKGITLKELCGDKISISKMSCIENGKMKADNETIEYISKIIDVDYNYLIEDIYDQIVINLKKLKQNIYNSEEFESKIEDNLRYALEYEYFELAFELIHMMISNCIKEEQFEKIQQIIPRYYTVYQKLDPENNTSTYLLDIAYYLYKREKYSDAIVYYSRVKEIEIANHKIDEKKLRIQFYEAKCYYELKNYGETYELLKRILEMQEIGKSDLIFGRVLNLYATVCIRFGYKEAEKYILDSNKYLTYNPRKFALAKKSYGEAYFSIKEGEKAIKEISEAIELFPKENNDRYVEFVNKCIEVYYDNEEFDNASELSENNLNLAIESQNINLIERSYYLKAIILEKLGKINESEKYMNLSLDSLMKFGSKEQILDRYTDMANLSYKLENINDSIKYFNFVINLDKLI